MSVLIKGMNKPDMCGHCKFATAFDCMVSGVFIKDHHKVNDDCPIVYIPPHGDLIDSRVAYDKIAEQEGGNYVDMDAVGKGLEATPVIIQAEEE